MRNVKIFFICVSLLCFLKTSLYATQTQTARTDDCAAAVKVTKDLDAPVLVSRAEPIVPKSLLAKKHSHSSATVEIVITIEGTIACAKVLKPEDPDFGKVVLEAITKWKYKPALKNGTPVPVCTRIFMSLTVR